MKSKEKFIKIFLVLLIVVPAISFSILLFTNKSNVGFSKEFVRESTYLVDGMTCKSCVKSITDTLNDMKFVVKSTVNYNDKSVTVKYNSKQVGFPDFSTALNDNGYTLKYKQKQQLKVLNAPNR